MTSTLGTISSASKTMLDELSDSGKAKIPVDVCTQLTAEFVPAVKEISKAGTELLRVYQALEKSSALYVHALEALVKSSKKAFPGAKTHANGLNELVAQYKQMLDQHKRSVAEFSSLVVKTTRYSSEEKIKIKDMLAKFQKEEKALEHQRKKGTKNSSDMQSFVNESAEEFLRQQEMRYKFFYEKHRAWFLSYSNLFQQKENGVTGATEKKVDEKPKVDTIEAATTVLSASDCVSKTGHSRVDSLAHSTVISPSSRKSTTDNFTETNALESTKLQSTSSTGSPTQERQVAEVTPAPAVVDAATQSASESPLIITKESPILTQIPEQYVNSEWNNNVVEIPVREYALSNVERRHSYVPVVDPMDYRPEEPENKRVNERRPPVGGRLVLPPIENNRPFYQVESEFISQAPPTHRPSIHTQPKPAPSVVPPLFNNSDYGRILTVTQDFNATSGEQITVNRGNKVVLIKNGSRGWIFIKDADSQRTGWIPAPFVTY
ncbi:hypothetical protein RB195_021884 [Necator americanus]|uniref:SH3 domain-containing protein n=1 Tax=Necator americanus TaxID=51031 RepID=A0ABR1ED18_NECAM